ncbi:MAG: hypothetical protein ACREIA_03780 [Opitutaceae bacterium]
MRRWTRAKPCRSCARSPTAAIPRAARRSPLAAESVFQKPEVIRALFAAALALEGASVPRASADAAKPASSGAGSSWTSDEERRLVEQFDASVSPAQIAKEHGRTRGAITSRLKKLGKIDAGTGDAVAVTRLVTTLERRPRVNPKPDDHVPF